MDLKTLTAAELDELRIAVITEQERRANLDAIPAQVTALAKVYRDGGGDEDVLRDALAPEQIEAIARV